MAAKITSYEQFKQLFQQGVPMMGLTALGKDNPDYPKYIKRAAQEGLIKGQGVPIGNIATGALGGLLTGGPVGALGGAIGGGIGSQRGQGALQSGLTGAAIGGVASGLGSALGAQSGFTSPLRQATATGTAGTGTTGGLGSLSTPLGKVGLGDLAKLGIAGLGTISAAKQQGKASDIAQQMAQQNAALAADQAKLRQQFMGQIGNLPSQAPDLGSLFQSSNPFARQPLANIQGPAPSVAPLAMPQLSPIEAQLQRARAGVGMLNQRMRQT